MLKLARLALIIKFTNNKNFEYFYLEEFFSCFNSIGKSATEYQQLYLPYFGGNQVKKNIKRAYKLIESDRYSNFFYL